MLDVLVVRVLSALLALVAVANVVLSTRGGPGRVESKEVRAALPVSAWLTAAWILLGFLPIGFYVVAVASPSWVYGTPLNLVFPGGEYVQIAGVLIIVAGGALATWSTRTLGRFMTPRIQVRADHELVTRGPYSRIRHPVYTAFLLLNAGTMLLYLDFILIAGFVVYFAIAEFRARREEQLLGSPGGFGERYTEYMSRTGRFLPSLGKR